MLKDNENTSLESRMNASLLNSVQRDDKVKLKMRTKPSLLLLQVVGGGI